MRHAANGRAGEDERQVLLLRHEGDLIGAAFQRGDQIPSAYLLRRCADGKKPGHLSPGLIDGHPARQCEKRSVLSVRQRHLQPFQVGLIGQQPDHRKDLRVDAEPG